VDYVASSTQQTMDSHGFTQMAQEFINYTCTQILTLTRFRVSSLWEEYEYNATTRVVTLSGGVLLSVLLCDYTNSRNYNNAIIETRHRIDILWKF
jgi:hypothetical protein